MKLLSFAKQLVVTAIVLVAANIVIGQATKNSLPRQLLRHGQETKGATHSFLGNSTMAAGLKESAFATARPGSVPLNLGLGDTGPVEHYLIYRQQQPHDAVTIYYGFLDTQLTDPPLGG